MLKHYLPLAIVPLALILWGLFGATQLTTSSYTAFVDYQSPYKERSTPGAQGDPLTGQVVIFVLGGLRLDQSRQMDNLNRLRTQGADRIVRVGQPSLSLPGWSVIGTGAWQEQHGQTTNFDARPLSIDSIFEAARRKGLSTALTGAPGWDILYKGSIDTIRVEPNPVDSHHHLDAVQAQDDAIEADALQLLRSNHPNLLLVHFTAPENANHGYGAFSAEAQRALQEVDARLGRLLQAIDLSQATVLVTSDHGHIDKGGHGGPEPAVLNVGFVAAGRGINPGRYGQMAQADIAPTLGVLLGTSIPAENQGDVQFDMLAMSEHAEAFRSVDWAQQIVNRYTVIDKVIGTGTVNHPKLAEAQAALALGNDSAAMSATTVAVLSARDAAFSFREGRLQQEQLMRTGAFILFLLPLVVYAWFMRRMDWEFRRPLIGAAVFFVIYYALYFGRGYTFSLSMLNDDTAITAWFAARIVDAIVALGIAAFFLGLLSRDEYRIWTVLNTINMVFFVAAILWLQVCVFYWFYDFTWQWYLPDQGLGFKYYLDTLQTGAFMLKSPPIPTILLLPLIALAGHWLVERSTRFVRAPSA